MIIQEIGQSLDTPDDLVFELFNKACFDGHTLAVYSGYKTDGVCP